MDRPPLKVMIWACENEERYAGYYVGAEAARQGLEVRVTGSRSKPQRMLITLNAYKPDVVLCFAIRPNFKPYYEIIRRSGAKLALWYPDMTEKRRDAMWRYLRASADILIFSILETAQRYQDLARTVLWMPQYFDKHYCCDANGQLPQRLNPDKPIYDLCFIGSCDRIRASWLEYLEKRYKCYFFKDGIKLRQEIRGYRMAEAYAQSKIAFNIQRAAFKNSGAYVTSNRIYNAMGSGAFFINHQVTHLDLAFPKSVCIMHNDSLSDLCRMIDYYLEHEKERERLAKIGQDYVLKYHSLEQRVHEYWHVLHTLYYNNTNSLISTTNHGNPVPVWAYGKWADVRRLQEI